MAVENMRWLRRVMMPDSFPHAPLIGKPSPPAAAAPALGHRPHALNHISTSCSGLITSFTFQNPPPPATAVAAGGILPASAPLPSNDILYDGAPDPHGGALVDLTWPPARDRAAASASGRRR
ncbi:NIMA-related serine/threonine kinase 1 [Striga asiatica]|uniref:NIMA-related serine/threonine kinase 1 n=1 Tax=Striga asiatica TaxID=4170 RepID=A0A5A7NZE8_STRAF|nr:NIMA-related serine/threonine kinase 1 [Striga asiatica]